MKSIVEKKIKSVIIGLAVADALGVPVEFKSRATLDADPVVDMRGYGTHNMPAGCWSDDTSMTLCALDSLAEGKLDLEEIMRNFGRWLTEDAYTATGVTFDIGGTCMMAIHRYFDGSGRAAAACGLDSEASNGNGSLMRILPFVLYLHDAHHDEDPLDIIHQASCLTHAHERSQMGCGIYALIVDELLERPRKSSVYAGLARARAIYGAWDDYHHYHRLFEGDIAALDRDDIRGSGYVVHTLEAALWCLLNTDSYEACVLAAANLGEDTDTVAAVAGGLAGAMYGYEAIPEAWRETLIRRDYIEDMCERAAEHWTHA